MKPAPQPAPAPQQDTSAAAQLAAEIPGGKPDAGTHGDDLPW